MKVQGKDMYKFLDFSEWHFWNEMITVRCIFVYSIQYTFCGIWYGIYTVYFIAYFAKYTIWYGQYVRVGSKAADAKSW